MTLLRGATLVEFAPPTLLQADLRIEGEQIIEQGPSLEPRGDERVLDLSGHLLMPGLVCSHTHLYSALARGMPAPSETPTSFRQILERVWWVLDRALDADSISSSGRVGALQAAASGTTLLIDHHASPSSIPGSLSLLREGLAEVGVRGVLCYEVTDRGGPDLRDAGLAENVRFVEATRDDPCFHGLIGAHASFTLGPDSLVELEKAALAARVPIHIHVAEDPCDFPDGGDDLALVQRLREAGLLEAAEGALVGHATHLGPRALGVLEECGCWLVHNARSNMNNHVGYAPVDFFPPERSALGTDGIDQDVFAEGKAAYFKNQDAGGHLLAEGVLRMIAGGHRLARHLFGEPFGSLRAGAPADLVILAYDPPTPLTPENLPWHLVFGITSSDIRSTIVAGRTIYDRGVFPLADQESIHQTARQDALRLWNRIRKLA